MDLLNSEPVVSLSGDEFLPIEGKTFIQQVQEFFAAQGGKANSPFGTVLLDKKGIKNDLGHGIGRLKAVSFAAVKDVLEKGVVINPMGQYHTNNKKNPTGMIAAPITIGGEKYVCVVEVIANRQVTRLYVHEVTLTKNLQGGVADSNAVPGDTNLVTQPQGEVAKVLRNYVNTKNNDENNSKTENRRHMNKKLIRLTEGDLKQIVKESVNKILKEDQVETFRKQQILQAYERVLKYQDPIEVIRSIGDCLGFNALETVLRTTLNGDSDAYARSQEMRGSI